MKTGRISRVSIACARGVHIAHQRGMHRAAAVASLALLVSLPAAAQDRAPHVRGERGTQRLIDDAARRSPAIQASLDALDALDVVVYVRAALFSSLEIDGRLALLSAVGTRRYLLIELACGRSELTQMTTLGHELFHALEIAAEPSVVDPETLADFYSRIGRRTGDTQRRRTFETEAA